jgi:hypothetical protein
MDWRIQEQDIVVLVADAVENDEPINTRTRSSVSSSFSTSGAVADSDEEFDYSIIDTNSGGRYSNRLRGLDPEYIETLDESFMKFRSSERKEVMKKPAEFEGFCPRHGIIIDKGKLVLRDHDHATEKIACYCPDNTCTTTFDVAVKKVSEELNIAEYTLKFWVSLVHIF